MPLLRINWIGPHYRKQSGCSGRVLACDDRRGTPWRAPTQPSRPARQSRKNWTLSTNCPRPFCAGHSVGNCRGTARRAPTVMMRDNPRRARTNMAKRKNDNGRISNTQQSLNGAVKSICDIMRTSPGLEKYLSEPDSVGETALRNCGDFCGDAACVCVNFGATQYISPHVGKSLTLKASRGIMPSDQPVTKSARKRRANHR